MDPLSLTISILGLAGVSGQCAGLLRSVASFKYAPRIVIELDDELPSLRRDIFAVQGLFLQPANELTSSRYPEILGDDTMATVVDCLEQANDLVIQLDSLVCPLLSLFLHSTEMTLKRRFRWLKEEKKLKEIEKRLSKTRSRLNTTLGFLG